MITANNTFMKKLAGSLLAMSLVIGLASCEKENKDDDMMQDPQLKSKTYNYEFNNGQLVAAGAYAGGHPGSLSADLVITEMENGGTKVTVNLMNTVNGEKYMIHAHDAADPATTPNGTPYNESPNANILVQMAEGNGGTVTVSQETSMSYADLTSNYQGFLVVHDPLQPVNTADISTYVIVGSFAVEQTPTNLKAKTFLYDFNLGQLVPSFAYSGSHSTNLDAMLTIQELVDGRTRVSVGLTNTIDGEVYPTHAHDAADPATTPNMTPYNESPNANVLVTMIAGNGGTAYSGQTSTMSYDELTATYAGFFVVHDPLQAINTADPTTYVILGSFARE